MTDPYNVLGISPDATQKEIKAAFKRRAKLIHPDRYSNKIESEWVFKEVVESYIVLSDSESGEGGRDYEWFKNYFSLRNQHIRMVILAIIIIAVILCCVVVVPSLLVLYLAPDSIGAYYVRDFFGL
jgi:preprotein translocase subunit Sec63